MSLSTTAHQCLFAILLATQVLISASDHGASPLPIHQAAISSESQASRVSRSLRQFPAVADSKNQTCECPPEFINRALKCDPFSCEWTLENGYWFGLSPEFNDTLVVALCPTDYCYANSTGSQVRIPAVNATTNPNSFICGPLHRTGVLCGECLDGYAPAINSDTFRCVSCSPSDERINWLYYILAVYLPLFLLFLFIIVFNIRLTSGPANAFILYAQVVSTTFDLSADGQIPLNTIYPYVDRLLRVYRVPYNIFNLNFISNILPPFCLSHNLISLDVIALNYIVATFPLMMILLVVLAYKCQFFHRIKFECCGQFLHRRGWRLANSLVHAFAAFILLSYTRFCLISALLVGLQPLLNEEGEYVGHQRLYFAGQFTSYDMTYILRYGLPAYLVFATFIAIPPILLLGFPIRWLEKLILKVKWLRDIYPFDKVNILLDTFQGCFKNNRRFFAGLYFLFRLALYATYMLTDTWLLQYTIQQILVTLYIVLIAVLWPYKRTFINYIDIAIFANMGILNILSLYLIDFNQITPDLPLPVGVFVLQYILIFAPLVYMIAYVVWYLTKPYHRSIQLKAKRSYRWLQSRQILRLRKRPESEAATSKIGRDDPLSEEDSNMEGILERATERNTYKQNPADYSVIVSPHSVLGSREVVPGTGTTSTTVVLEDNQDSFGTPYHKLNGDP